MSQFIQIQTEQSKIIRLFLKKWSNEGIYLRLHSLIKLN